MAKLPKTIKLLIVLTFAMIMTPVLSHSVNASTFSDVRLYEKEISYLYGNGIIKGYSDGTFKPDQPIKRLQAVQMILKDMGINTDNAPDPNLKDMKPGDYGFEVVAKAVELGIISGKDDGRFDPWGTLTRGQMAKILVNAYGLYGIYPYGFTDVSDHFWGNEFISSLAANNITTGYPDGSFRPNDSITRAHFSVFLARLMEPSFLPDNPKIKDTMLEVLMDINIMDYDVHPTEPILYFLDGFSNSVVSFNYQTYELKEVPFSLPAERMDYANGYLYVTLLKGTHSSYWWNEDQTGAFAVVDVNTMKIRNVVHIEVDPFDIAADDQGVVYITPGSGQHGNIKSFDSKSGEILSDLYGVYERSYIEMHPSQDRVYLIDTTLSPRDIESYPIQNGKLQAGKDSPYHGDYQISPDLKISDDGRYLFNQSGHIFMSSATPSADMTYVGKLDREFSSITFDITYGGFYAANNRSVIQAYDYDTMKATFQLESYGNIKHLIIHHDVIIALTELKLPNSAKTFIGLETIYLNHE